MVLLKLNTRSDEMYRFTKSEGLPSNMIYAIQEDDEGSLWASTNSGIFSINLRTEEIKIFTQTDGLQADDFYKSSAFKGKEGTLYFGGVNGFNIFKPELIKANTKIPEVYITHIEVGGETFSINNTDQIESIFNGQKVICEHHENDFTFQFIAINYLQSAKNQYKYKLENYDEDWRSIGSDKLAQYANVPPGKYIFRVIASNNDELWNEEGAHVLIHIQKPWYATHLAYTLYFLFFFGDSGLGQSKHISKRTLAGRIAIGAKGTRLKFRRLTRLKLGFLLIFLMNLRRL